MSSLGNLKPAFYATYSQIPKVSTTQFQGVDFIAMKLINGEHFPACIHAGDGAASHQAAEFVSRLRVVTGTIA